VTGEIQRFQREKLYVHKAGHLVWGNVSASVVRDDAERPLYIITVIDDITARKRADEGLQHALALRDQFLSIASHELKTPLTTLQLQSQALQRDVARSDEGTPATERLRERAARIRAHVGRMTDLVHKLLDVSRINAGRLPLSPEDVWPAEIAGDVLLRFEDEARRSHCDLVGDLDRSVGPARWDRLKIDQVLMNLVGNAIKYGAGSPVEIRLEASDRGARFVVRDHGIGLPPGTEGRLFERFERFVSERNYGGFGVGLWIARELVHAHQGEIRADPVEGRGAQFVVELPLAPVLPTPSTDANP
jgi:signal transduction histidine kinase